MCDGGGADVFESQALYAGADKEYMPPEPKTWQQAVETPVWEVGSNIDEVKMHGMVKNSCMSRWIDQRTSPYLGLRCLTKDRSDRTVRSRSANVDLSLKGFGRLRLCALHGEGLTYPSDRVNPDSLSHDSS